MKKVGTHMELDMTAAEHPSDVPAARASTEVVAVAKRRKFTTAYMQRIGARITSFPQQPRAFFGNRYPPRNTERSDPVLRGAPGAARVSPETGGCVMCERTAGVAGTPRAPCPLPSLAEVFKPARIFSRIRMGCGQATKEIR